MCGIFGQISTTGRAVSSTLNGIGGLLHRGYDSMGIVFIEAGLPRLYKVSHAETGEALKIDDLRNMIPDLHVLCNLAIGHTRWATFGLVNKTNAHPHFDSSKRFFIVHNGNAENMEELKKSLVGVDFYSETDSEVFVNLVARYYQGDMMSTLSKVLRMIEGANAFVILDAKDPHRLYAANKGGPMLLAKTEDQVIITSDPMALENLNVQNQQIVGDNEIVCATAGRWEIEKVASEKNQASGYEEKNKEHCWVMEKEIFEQPGVVSNIISGRIVGDRGVSKLGGIEDVSRELRKAQTFHFIGCGTAYHACYYAQLLFNRFGLGARAWVASEFCYVHPIIDSEDVFIFISQSGETADSIEVLNEAKIKGNLALGMVNVQGSRIARETDAGIYLRAGKEVGVASTKAYTAMLTNIVLLAVFLARQRKMTIDTGQRILTELSRLPAKIKEILAMSDEIKSLACENKDFKNYYFLGRYFSYITAEEGALKLKEISYTHAEGYGLGEMKHGPLALVDPNFCSVVVIPRDGTYAKGINNIREIKSRNGYVMAITDGKSINIADKTLLIPSTLDYLMPILSVVPIQLYSYYMALEHGCNPDMPRNLAKTVTVA